jgi:hypothetical protein
LANKNIFKIFYYFAYFNAKKLFQRQKTSLLAKIIFIEGAIGRVLVVLFVLRLVLFAT